MLENRRKRNTKENDFFSRIKTKSFPRKKTLRRFLLAFLFFFVLYIYFAGDYGFLRLVSLKRQKESVILETKKLQAMNMDMQIENEKLRDDLSYIEKVARERYGMAKKDEVIYKFIQPQDTSSTPLPKNR